MLGAIEDRGGSETVARRIVGRGSFRRRLAGAFDFELRRQRRAQSAARKAVRQQRVGDRQRRQRSRSATIFNPRSPIFSGNGRGRILRLVVAAGLERLHRRQPVAVSGHGVAQLEVGRRGRDVEIALRVAHEFAEAQRAVVHRARQAEPVVHQCLLARAVALIHAADLRHRGVRLVHHEQEILGEEVEQRVRPRARRAAGEVTRVVLDARAEPHLLEHFEVVLGAQLDALGFEQLALALEPRDALVELAADRAEREAQLVGRRHELLGRIQRDAAGHRPQHRAGERVHHGKALHLVAEELDAVGRVVEVARLHLDHVAAHPEAAAAEGDVVALVEHVHEPAEQLFARKGLALIDPQQHRAVVRRRAQAVDARHAGHHDHVRAREERRGGRKAQALDLLVDGRILLDVGVGARDVGLGLVVVEVGNEILHRVVREELPELRVELRRERLVVRHHERGPPEIPDDVGGREGLARAGDAEERLVPVAGEHRARKPVDGRALVAARLVGGGKLERRVRHRRPEEGWRAGALSRRHLRRSRRPD